MDDAYGCRLTARQRARLEKEAGIAEDVAWHEMDLLPNLTYTWKGKGVQGVVSGCSLPELHALLGAWGTP